MDWSDKIQGRGGCFILNAGDDTDSLNANVTGAKKSFWGFMSLDGAGTLTTLTVGGSTALGDGTAGVNYGYNVSSAYVWPQNVLITCSSPAGFTRLVASGGAFLVWRQTSSLESNMQ